MRETTSTGIWAEEQACKYLLDNDYKIISRNARTRFYEIDIIATQDRQLVFVEVKFRKNTDFGGGEGSISTDKIKRLKFAIADWVTKNKQFSQLQPRLDAVVITSDENNIIHYQNITT